MPPDCHYSTNISTKKYLFSLVYQVLSWPLLVHCWLHILIRRYWKCYWELCLLYLLRIPYGDQNDLSNQPSYLVLSVEDCQDWRHDWLGQAEYWEVHLWRCLLCQRNSILQRSQQLHWLLILLGFLSTLVMDFWTKIYGYWYPCFL